MEKWLLVISSLIVDGGEEVVEWFCHPELVEGSRFGREVY